MNIPVPTTNVSKGVELEEKILEILGKDSSFQESLRKTIISSKENEESYVAAAKKYYYALIKERDFNVPIHCLTSELVKNALEFKEKDKEHHSITYYIKDAIKYNEKELKK